jgi:hypothetical protein
MQYCPAEIVPESCAEGPAWTVLPLTFEQVVPSHVPTPSPIEIVAGGPAAVRSTVIWKPDDTTVNGFASFDPGWTVPEKFSVTSGVDGVVGSGVDVEVSVLEQPAARAETTIRTAKVCFTSASLKNNYVAEPWRPEDKSNPLTALISSSLTVWPIRG